MKSISGLLTISETASKIGVSADTVRRWEKKGLIKSFRNEHNHRVFSIREIERMYRKITAGVKDKESNYKILKAPKKSKYTAIDLFAGAGGTALGLEHAGLSHLLLNEFDKYAAETLRLNRPEWNVSDKDIHEVDFKKWKGKIDVLEGGFPCQAFSYAGKRLGFEDTRGTLFHEFARAVKQIQPKVAIGENVRGLLTHDNGRTLETMAKVLQDLGYHVAYKVLRSQYLDVPQKRERLIIMAVKKGVADKVVFPREHDYVVSLREAIGDKPKSVGQVYSEYKFKIMDQVPEGGYWRDLSDELQRDYMKASYFHTGGKTGMARRLSWDEPSLTLTCNPAQKQTERCHPEETRPLNVREYARIQTFPDSWKFAGSVSQQYKQIGNAVPVNLGYYMGLAAIAMIDGKYDDDLFETVSPLGQINDQEIESVGENQLSLTPIFEI